MDARICTNPACRTILPYHTCTLCNAPSEALPALSLLPIGVDATARLVHTPPHGYSILVHTPTALHNVNVTLPDLLHAAQAHLPYVNTMTGPMIMGILDTAATLIRTRNTDHWTGWILYLLDKLQDYTDAASFLEVLTRLLQDITTLVPDADPPPGDA